METCRPRLIRSTARRTTRRACGVADVAYVRGEPIGTVRSKSRTFHVVPIIVLAVNSPSRYQPLQATFFALAEVDEHSCLSRAAIPHLSIEGGTPSNTGLPARTMEISPAGACFEFTNPFRTFGALSSRERKIMIWSRPVASANRLHRHWNRKIHDESSPRLDEKDAGPLACRTSAERRTSLSLHQKGRNGS